jgi:hypothetical protein
MGLKSKTNRRGTETQRYTGMLSTMIHKYGNVCQPQERNEKNLLFVIGELLFVIESSQFQGVK